MADERDEQDGSPAPPASTAVEDRKAQAAKARRERREARAEERKARRRIAMKETAAARAARIAAGKHYTGIEGMGHRAFQGVAVAAGVAGVFAAISWLSEHNDRIEEREARKAALVESAYRAISDLQPEGQGALRMSQRLQWAFDTLARYGQTIEVVAYSIDLTGADLTCGTFLFRATESILIDDASIVNARVLLDTRNSFVDADISGSGIIDTVPDVPGWPHSTFIRGRVYKSLFMVGGASAFDLEAEGVGIVTAEGSFMFSGAPGILFTTEEHRVGPYWPISMEAEESRARRDALSIIDLSGDVGVFTGTAVLESSPGKRDLEAKVDARKPTQAFVKLCPGGVCRPAPPWKRPPTPSCDPVGDALIVEETRDRRRREYFGLLLKGGGHPLPPSLWLLSQFDEAPPPPEVTSLPAADPL